jgi:hypothetical protein
VALHDSSASQITCKGDTHVLENGVSVHLQTTGRVTSRDPPAGDHIAASRGIHCELHTVDLAEQPKYKALSYTWGENRDHKRIAVNGQTFMVRPNLFEFLQVYRTRKDRGLIWIDQLCIDQNSTTEKNHQVGMMDHVYRGAEETLVWLGCDPYQGRAFAVMRRLQRKIHDGGFVIGAYNSIAVVSYDRKAVHALFYASYWGRHWVAQEVMLSAECVLCYGRSEMLLEDLIEVVLSFDELHGKGLNVIRSKSYTPFSYFRYLVSSADNLEDLRHFFETTSLFCYHSVCENIRDKVYGIQSVLPAALRLPVDYSLPVRSVYLGAVELWHQSYTTRRILNFLQDCTWLAKAMDVARESTPGGWDFVVEELGVHLSSTKQANVKIKNDNWLTWEEVKDFLNARILEDDSTLEAPVRDTMAG